MTTAEKKEILSRETLQGEIRINDSYAGPLTFKLDKIGLSCMAVSRDGVRFHVQTHEKNIQLWVALNAKENTNALILSTYIHYDQLDILSAMHQGQDLILKPASQKAA